MMTLPAHSHLQLTGTTNLTLLLWVLQLKNSRKEVVPIHLANGNSSQNSDSTSGDKSGTAGAGHTSGNDDGSDDFKATNEEDTGTGMVGSDYVGKATGNMIDDSIADTVSGGGTVGEKTSDVSGTTVGGVTTSEAELGNANSGSDIPKAGKAIKSGEPGASDAGKEPSGALGINDKSPKTAITEDDDQERKAVDRGTGTGAAMNNLNEEDADTGTGSARRGNRAGMPDEDSGTISGGTMTSTGIDDAGLGPEK
ncbi:hypothetical protein Q0590_02805 [Rhodocytophaga aerolata]|uniref:Uncharacterized protein n=1 Tax=Rhodocytophaga aerolata TaxID=455078 RepID=A0ABT8QZ94_9BACT|nr:hypothetical protein [Rhodocytophaga aerolata]MDO1445160.1 hypothetical protein [Rhodocytophaga aerolata]